jgi:hypothetical protein
MARMVCQASVFLSHAFASQNFVYAQAKAGIFNSLSRVRLNRRSTRTSFRSSPTINVEGIKNEPTASASLPRAGAQLGYKLFSPSSSPHGSCRASSGMADKGSVPARPREIDVARRTKFSELPAQLPASRQDRLAYYAFDLLLLNPQEVARNRRRCCKSCSRCHRRL